MRSSESETIRSHCSLYGTGYGLSVTKTYLSLRVTRYSTRTVKYTAQLTQMTTRVAYCTAAGPRKRNEPTLKPSSHMAVT